MWRKTMIHMSTALVAVMFYALPALATDIIEGQIKEAGNDKITIESIGGRTSTVSVTLEAKITRDGKSVKLDDLKASDAATVTLDNHMRATVIEAKSGKLGTVSTVALALDRHQGTCVNAGSSRITLLDQNGKDKISFAVVDNAKVTRDGRSVALEEVKAGDKLSLSTERRLLQEVVIEIDATTQN